MIILTDDASPKKLSSMAIIIHFVWSTVTNMDMKRESELLLQPMMKDKKLENKKLMSRWLQGVALEL